MDKKKTIKKVSSELTSNQRKTIVNEVALKGKIAGVTVYRYLTGEAEPMYLYKELITNVVNSVLKTSHTIEELWPDA